MTAGADGADQLRRSLLLPVRADEQHRQLGQAAADELQEGE